MTAAIARAQAQATAAVLARKWRDEAADLQIEGLHAGQDGDTDTKAVCYAKTKVLRACANELLDAFRDGA